MKICRQPPDLHSSLPGLTRQSILFERLLRRWMDTRVKPAYDAVWCALRAGNARLHRLDLHLAPLQHAGAVLQRERSLGEPGILHVGGLLAVQHVDEMR